MNDLPTDSGQGPEPDMDERTPSPEESPPGQDRRSWVPLLLTGAIVLAATFLVWRQLDGIATGLTAWNEGGRSEVVDEPPPPLLEVSEDMREVLVFFPREEGGLLGVEYANIFDLTSASARGKLILERLALGPESGDLRPCIPADALVRELWISPEGTAYVDYSRQLGRNHPGGTTAELQTVYSIVNSLVYNLSEVRRVQILIEGHDVDTLSGHLALWMPLSADLSLVESTSPSNPSPARAHRDGSTAPDLPEASQ